MWFLLLVVFVVIDVGRAFVVIDVGRVFVIVTYILHIFG